MSRYTIPHMEESLKDHVLTKLVASKCASIYNGDATVFRMGPANGNRCMSTMLVFTPEGIVLMGDLTPNRNGSVSAIGYGLDWFVGRLDGSYLCEKFLKEEWVQELAIKELKRPDSYLREDADEKTLEALDRIAEELPDRGGEWLYNELGELTDYWDSCPGTDYVPSQAGWLIAIQKKFAQLYHEQKRIEDAKWWPTFKKWCKSLVKG